MGFTRVQAQDGPRLQELADALVSAKKVIMITGAGISTSCGIPDFRSPEGLYSLIKDAHGQIDPGSIGTRGKDLFDGNLWRNEASTQTFYKFIASLRQKVAEDVKKTSLTHKLIAKLKDQKKLVRCYTQNIDGLEAREGLSMDLEAGQGNRQRFGRKAMGEVRSSASASTGGVHHNGCEVVPLHGDLKELRCTVCSDNTEWTPERQATMLIGQAPACPNCEEKDMIRTAMGRRGLKVGALRPDIVLYGENHPGTDSIGNITEADLRIKPDVLLVMGTSLKVHGLKNLVREFAKAVHEKKGGKVVFVNFTEPAESTWKDVFDHWVEMDCDAFVKDMKHRRGEFWMTQTQLESHVIKSTPSSTQAPKPTSKKTSTPRSKHTLNPTTKTTSNPATKLAVKTAIIDLVTPAKAPTAIGKSTIEKATFVHFDQENVAAEATQTESAKQNLSQSVAKGRKRTASAIDLEEPNTPKRRKPLESVLTPSSSRRQGRSAPTTLDASLNRSPKRRTPAGNDVFFSPPSYRGTATAPRRSSKLPLTPQPTPSRRKVDPWVQAVLMKSKNAQPDVTDLTEPSPQKSRRTSFDIFEDQRAVGASMDIVMVADSEDEVSRGQNAVSQNNNTAAEAHWQEEDEETIELIPVSHAMDQNNKATKPPATPSTRGRASQAHSSRGVAKGQSGRRFIQVIV